MPFKRKTIGCPCMVRFCWLQTSHGCDGCLQEYMLLFQALASPSNFFVYLFVIHPKERSHKNSSIYLLNNMYWCGRIPILFQSNVFDGKLYLIGYVLRFMHNMEACLYRSTGIGTLINSNR